MVSIRALEQPTTVVFLPRSFTDWKRSHAKEAAPLLSFPRRPPSAKWPWPAANRAANGGFITVIVMLFHCLGSSAFAPEITQRG